MTTYAMQVGIPEGWKAGDKTVNLEAAMMCSDDAGVTWRPFVNSEPIAKGSVLRFFVYDLAESTAGVNIAPVHFFNRSASVEVKSPRAGGLSGGPYPMTNNCKMTEAQFETEESLKTAPSWIDDDKQPRGELKPTRRVSGNLFTYELRNEGAFVLGLDFKYPGQGRHMLERQVVVGGGDQKAALEIRLVGGQPYPNEPRLSKGGKGRPDQVIFAAEDEEYTISLTSNLWVDSPNQPFSVTKGQRSQPFQLSPDAPLGLREAYHLTYPGKEKKSAHPPNMIIDP